MEWRRPGTGRVGAPRLGDKITHVDLVKSWGRFTWNCRRHEGRGRPGRVGTALVLNTLNVNALRKQPVPTP